MNIKPGIRLLHLLQQPLIVSRDFGRVVSSRLVWGQIGTEIHTVDGYTYSRPIYAVTILSLLNTFTTVVAHTDDNITIRRNR